MLYTIVNIADVFYQLEEREQPRRSSNPYDYLRSGYFLDNAALFGGENNVHYHCDISSHITGADVHSSR